MLRRDFGDVSVAVRRPHKVGAAVGGDALEEAEVAGCHGFAQTGQGFVP